MKETKWIKNNNSNSDSNCARRTREMPSGRKKSIEQVMEES